MASAQNGATSQRGAKHRRAAHTPAAWGGRSMKAALAVLVMLVAAFASAENLVLQPSRALQLASGHESQEVRGGGAVQTTTNEGHAGEGDLDDHRGRNLKKKKNCSNLKKKR